MTYKTKTWSQVCLSHTSLLIDSWGCWCTKSCYNVPPKEEKNKSASKHRCKQWRIENIQKLSFANVLWWKKHIEHICWTLPCFTSNTEFKTNFCVIKAKLHGAPLNLKLSAPEQSADLFTLRLLSTYLTAVWITIVLLKVKIWSLLQLEALDAKNISGAVEDTQVASEPFIDNSKRERRAPGGHAGLFLCLGGVEVFTIWSQTSLFFQMALSPSLKNTPDAGWIESHCTSGPVIRAMTSKASGFSLLRCSRSVLLQCVCSSVPFCPCLSQLSGLIYQCHSKEGFNNKVQCVQYSTITCVSVLSLLTFLFNGKWFYTTLLQQ